VKECGIAFLCEQVAHMTKAEASLKHLILEACNIVTIAVPPALPAGRKVRMSEPNCCRVLDVVGH
jgi:hypothetical protein